MDNDPVAAYVNPTIPLSYFVLLTSKRSGASLELNGRHVRHDYNNAYTDSSLGITGMSSVIPLSRLMIMVWADVVRSFGPLLHGMECSR